MMVFCQLIVILATLLLQQRLVKCLKLACNSVASPEESLRITE
jgi:hypothetical protein